MYLILHPMMKELAKKSGLTQDNVYAKIEKMGESWLDACGYKVELYRPARCAIRVAWGEWGIEHITVPGNACGLDISDNSFSCVFMNGRTMSPHNLDSWQQQNLLIMVFTSFMMDIAYRVSSDDKTYFRRSTDED